VPYYLRLFTPEAGLVPVKHLRREIDDVKVVLEDGSEEDWRSVVISSAEDEAICSIERAVLERDPIAAAEIEEFRDEVLLDAAPASGAAWVRRYLSSARAVYACQFLPAAFEPRHGDVPAGVLQALKHRLGGIVQADHEGFTNEDGYTVAWDFSDSASGTWQLAVLDERVGWVPFEMELSDPTGRTAFLEGRVPPGARRL
jgi:hypothetical protein